MRNHRKLQVGLIAIIFAVSISTVMMLIQLAAVDNEIPLMDGNIVPTSSPAVQYIGRFANSKEGKRFDMAGSEMRVRVQDTKKLSILIHTYFPAPLTEDEPAEMRNIAFAVYIDGALQPPRSGTGCGYRECTFVTMPSGNDTADAYTIALDLKGKHDVRVVQSTEAHWSQRHQKNWMTFMGFQLEGGNALLPVRPLPKRRIEVIGDSVSSGYCNTCKGPMDPESIRVGRIMVDWTSAPYWLTQLDEDAEGAGNWQSHPSSWPALMCHYMDAQCHVTAWSGMGLTSECCNGNDTIESAWKRTVQTDPTSEWTFSEWIPEVLIINIGMLDGQNVFTKQWEDKYTDMVQTASKAYGEELQVFLACGPITTRYCAPVHTVLKRVQGLGIKADFLDQRPFLNGTYGGACCGHPSKEVAHAMAKAAEVAIDDKMGWSGKQHAQHSWSTYECDTVNHITHGNVPCSHGLLENLLRDHDGGMGGRLEL